MWKLLTALIKWSDVGSQVVLCGVGVCVQSPPGSARSNIQTLLCHMTRGLENNVETYDLLHNLKTVY